MFSCENKMLSFICCLFSHFVIDVFVGWLVVLGLAALRDSISVYIRPSLRESEKEERNDRREKKTYTQPPTRA